MAAKSTRQGGSVVSSKQTMAVLVQDYAEKDILSSLKSVQVLHLADIQSLESVLNLFVLTSATRLAEVADVVRAANQKHHLRGLFIREDVDSKWLPQMFDRANLRVMRNTFVYANSDIPKRVINAWVMSAQDQLIANAIVIDDSLLVFSCEMEKFEVPFSSLPALQQIPLENRRNFIVADDGSYLYWETEDIHLDLEAFRWATDPEWKQKFEALKLIHNQVFGKAIAQIRKLHKLRQADILGLSDRQVRRIEQGEGSTKIDTLKLFAKAHGMEINDYLNAVAEAIKDIPEDFILSSDVDKKEPKLIDDDLRRFLNTEKQVEVIKNNINSECPSLEEWN